MDAALVPEYVACLLPRSLKRLAVHHQHRLPFDQCLLPCQTLQTARPTRPQASHLIFANLNPAKHAGALIHQTVVAASGGHEHVATFFPRAALFHTALRQLEDPALAAALPPAVRVSAGGALDPNGGLLPKFIVRERGVTLRTWARVSRPDFAAAARVRSPDKLALQKRQTTS